jgi:hypothetical protein
LPNGAVGCSAKEAERSWFGACARAPSATVRANPGLAKAPTWIAHPPLGSAERPGSACGDGVVGWCKAADAGRALAGGDATALGAVAA